MEPFIFNSHPARVIFGRGTIESTASEAERLGCRRLLLISTEFQADVTGALAERLGDRVAGSFPGAQMHTPVDVTEQALERARACDADGLVALGGGSSIGLAKAIAVRTDLPQIVLPTTYAGSEMTPILGETKDGLKTTRSDPRILPETVIYDVDLTLTLPVAMSVTSGFNAMAHAIEALYARDRNPIFSIMAAECVRAMTEALPRLVRHPVNLAARGDALYAAWLGGMCLGSVGMALHHKLCHVLGGTFNLPHAETHTVMLPHALAYNQAAAGKALDGIRAHLGDDPANALYRLAVDLGAPISLKQLGMAEEGIDEAARLAIANPYWNPQPLEQTALRALIANAWAGLPPLTQGEVR